MAKLINAKCPNCGAILELPENLDRAFCMHCGGKVIIAKDIHYHGGKTAIACPECQGLGYVGCHGEQKEVQPPFELTGKEFHTKFIYHFYHMPCHGYKTGKCTVRMFAESVKYRKRSTLDPTNPVFCENGVCARCKGTGKTPWGLTCYICKGTKICFVCKGNGICSYCNGEGKMICEACNGTGFKVYEGG